MKRKLILTFTFFLSTLLLGFFTVACRKGGISPTDSCNGISPKPQFLKITSYSARKLNASGPVYADLETDYKELRLEIIPSVEQFSVKISPEPPSVFLSSALACSPVSSTVHQLSKLEIIAENSGIYLHQTDTIHSGDTLNSRFLATRSGLANVSIQDFLLQEKKGSENASTIVLKLKDKPEKPLTLLFTVQLLLSDGKSFTIKGNKFLVK